ncbi:MAG TPA: hypothetical protein VF466_03310 [Candidatus Saccharimonadales bacterium]
MQLYITTGVRTLADVYGSGTYGTGVYTCTGTDRTTCSTASSSSGSTLTNTGIAVGLIVGVAAVLLMTVILVRFWRRPAKQPEPAVEPVEVESDDSEAADETLPRE